AVPRKSGSVLSPERKSQLPAHDCALDVADAGNDYPFVRRMVPDAGDRPTAVPGVDVFHLEFLPGLAKRAVSAALGTHVPLPAVPDGARHRPDPDQHACGD